MTRKSHISLPLGLFFGALIFMAAVDGQGWAGLRVLMLGDSLTAGGDWAALLPGADCVNQGVSGETSGQILRRLDRAAEANPDLIFLLAGINDLYSRPKAGSILANHQAIWQGLAQRLPRARLMVISLTPVDERKYPGLNRRIRSLNQALAREAQKAGLSFINLYDPLADGEGALRPEYSYDGLHFSAQGYRIWAETIKPYLKEDGR